MTRTSQDTELLSTSGLGNVRQAKSRRNFVSSSSLHMAMKKIHRGESEIATGRVNRRTSMWPSYKIHNDPSV